MITVIGSSNIDFTIKVDRLPKTGEPLSGADIFMDFGGKGANQAAQIAKLKKPVSFVGNIGKDLLGDKCVANLKALRVNTKYISRDKLHKSGLAFIIVDKNGRNLIIVSPGSNHKLTTKHIVRAKKLIQRSKIILLQLEIPINVVKKVISLSLRGGPKTQLSDRGHRPEEVPNPLDSANLSSNPIIILNPAPCRFCLDTKTLSKVDILTPNEVEAEVLTGIKGRTDKVIKKQGEILLRKGVGCVVITRGKRGVSVIDKTGFRSFKAKKVKPVDTTCAGDSFNASLAASLYEGKSIDQAVRFAIKTASITTTRIGAQSSLPTLRQLT